LPRFASSLPFLCLIVLHLLWPDMTNPRGAQAARTQDCTPQRQTSPDVTRRQNY
jgi:hypothetical protein